MLIGTMRRATHWGSSRSKSDVYDALLCVCLLCTAARSVRKKIIICVDALQQMHHIWIHVHIILGTTLLFCLKLFHILQTPGYCFYI